MSSLALWSVINIVALIAGLAIYLFIVSSQLKRVATNLEDSADLVWGIKRDAEAIDPGLTSINSTGRVVAGALPLLYGMGEGIVLVMLERRATCHGYASRAHDGGSWRIHGRLTSLPIESCEVWRRSA